MHASLQERESTSDGLIGCAQKPAPLRIFETLTSFRGVGPKIAALTLAVGFDTPAIAVDIHVHRVTNRWGLVQTATPEQTLPALEAVIPRHNWTELNRLLVPFGKYICTGRAPHCSTCPLLDICQQRQVITHR